jgi:hypothetical protein
MEAILSHDSPSTNRTTPSGHGTSAATLSKGRRWAGAALSGLAVLFLLFDSAMKLVKVAPVVEAMQRMGFPDESARPIGLILLACLVLYLVPRTAVLGAVLLTGYLGGAVVTHVRVADPLFSHTLFPVYFGTLVWAGLYLRDARVRSIAPWTKEAAATR